MESKSLLLLGKHTLSKHYHELPRIGMALFFLLMVMIYSLVTGDGGADPALLAVAAVLGAYMAMNIGANDVANHVGPAVGAKALTMSGAIVIAMVFEAGGALIAGGDVVVTIKQGIIDIHFFDGRTAVFLWVMMSALLAAAWWLNIATMIKVPVSTTHSIVGGIMGAGIAAAGHKIVNWEIMGLIAASWVLSPVVGGLIAAMVLYAVKRTIVFRADKVAAAYRWVPVYMAMMAFAFVVYLILKGFSHIWQPMIAGVDDGLLSAWELSRVPTGRLAFVMGGIVAALVFIWVRRTVWRLEGLQNNRDSINRLFMLPLGFAVALLSFAHGANDVANAVGPLAAISEVLRTGNVVSEAGIPFWVMIVGALGLIIGLALYGSRLIRTVGNEITELDPIRAFAIAMAAAVTVIMASQLGLPVSSTHIAVGGVFGVGFLREWMGREIWSQKALAQREAALQDARQALASLYTELRLLDAKDEKTTQDYDQMTRLYHAVDNREERIKMLRKQLKKEQKQYYVKRDAMKKIITAWVITVPSAAVMAASIFFAITEVALP